MEFRQDQLKRSGDFAPIEDVKTDFEASPSTLRTRKDLSVRQSLHVNASDVQMLRGQVVNRKATASSYSTAVSDFLISVTSLATAPTIELPRPRLVSIGKTYIVKDEAGGAATTTITVRSGGEENIDGATTSTLTSNYQAKCFYTNGSDWFTY